MKKKYREAYSRFRALRRVAGIVVASDTIRADYGRQLEQKIWETYVAVPFPGEHNFYLWRDIRRYLAFSDGRYGHH